MCGGRGTRLGLEEEKPLVEIDGRAMVDRVLEALANSAVDHVYAVVSPNAPETRAHLEGRVSTIGTPGEGYVADLDCALDRVDRSVLTAAADLPLLALDAVDAVLARHEGESTTVCVPAALKRELGVSVDTAFEHEGRELAPTGLNVVDGGDDRIEVSEDPRLAVNVNRARDAVVAERLLSLGANDTNLGEV
ncbi:NTP transferase domain-containing protein [Halalkalicoccus ordinarius]|uniref:NTP transferase domain-containing protein n=1 Tax=Halalkalicoccus ordinarius TaxID=3116651 RepID=UPI00300F6821